MIILLSPANSQCEFARNSQYCGFQAEFAANSRCERIGSEFGEFKLNSLRICIPTERPDTGAVVSFRWKWRLQSGRALPSPGPLPPPSAMEAPGVLWQRRGEMGGGFICGIPWPPR